MRHRSHETRHEGCTQAFWIFAAHAMPQPSTQDTNRTGWHRLWTWCAASLLVLLAGCSFTFLAYSYADRIILWELDHYFDLTSEQRNDLGLRLKSLLARHRHEAIPQYEAGLVQIRQRFEQGLTGQDIDWVYATYDRLRVDLFNRLVGRRRRLSRFRRFTPGADPRRSFEKR